MQKAQACKDKLDMLAHLPNNRQSAHSVRMGLVCLIQRSAAMEHADHLGGGSPRWEPQLLLHGRRQERLSCDGQPGTPDSTREGITCPEACMAWFQAGCQKHVHALQAWHATGAGACNTRITSYIQN